MILDINLDLFIAINLGFMFSVIVNLIFIFRKIANKYPNVFYREIDE